MAWEGRTPAEVLEQVLREEFDVTDHLTFARSYGAVVKTGQRGKVYPDFTDAVAGCDRWQILSPVRGRAHGTADLNRHLKDVFRQEAFEEATPRRGPRRFPKPFGPEQIVLGDKVVNNRNQYLYAQPKSRGRADNRRYVANGELGVVTGEINFTSPPWATKVEFSSQPDWRFTYRKDSDDSPLELAWALTVHKSQGSEFGTVVLMLPENTRGISRELLYTALTRQTDRIVICHEGSLEHLVDLGQPTASDICRRLTDLITPSRPVLVRNRRGEPAGVVDRNFFPHLTRTGIPVRSKNEVIIADLLHQLAPNMWEYERPLPGRDGKKVKPDFTIDTDDPERPIYWEWKVNWYAENGILPAPDGGPRGILLVTDDLNGVNEPQWQARFKAVFTTEVGIQARTVQRRPHRPAPPAPEPPRLPRRVDRSPGAGTHRGTCTGPPPPCPARGPGTGCYFLPLCCSQVGLVAMAVSWSRVRGGVERPGSALAVLLRIAVLKARTTTLVPSGCSISTDHRTDPLPDIGAPCWTTSLLPSGRTVE
ncbi:ATP-binding domain-containing protein [Kitasatospora purpeofusca]|uniref:ATP-binding domain-containing protein n=1 Tax=Kitasatospora purpeofusca TaxID=67352 RepID=UPI0035DD5E82